MVSRVPSDVVGVHSLSAAYATIRAHRTLVCDEADESTTSGSTAETLYHGFLARVPCIQGPISAIALQERHSLSKPHAWLSLASQSCTH